MITDEVRKFLEIVCQNQEDRFQFPETFSSNSLDKLQFCRSCSLQSVPFVKFNPLNLHSMADYFFGYPLRRFFWSPAVFQEPSGAVALLDWLETSIAHIFKVNVPGFSKDEIKVQVDEGNVLHIKGISGKEEPLAKETIWHLSERHPGKRDFSRKIELPENVKLDQIKAQVENGLLTIVVPKDTAPRSSKVRNINITSKL